MKVFRGLPNAESRAPCALTIGNFDGVHRGHQALLARLREAADRLQLDSAAMTFEPHPREYFAAVNGGAMTAPRRIASLRDKLASLERHGVDRVIVEHFHAGFAALPPERFVQDILVQGLQTKWLLVGEDFRYGAKRAGDLASLRQAGAAHGFDVEVFQTVTDGDIRISSSAVRAALAAGDFPLAERLLGHPYTISGHVIRGKQLGRTLGFPTLNLHVAHKNPALAGIFVVAVRGLAANPLPAVASLGVRPTVDDSGRVLLEVHVFDFAQDCYGRLVQVEFLHKLRDEEKYADLASLTAAIARDADQARAWFRRRQTPAISATDRI